MSSGQDHFDTYSLGACQELDGCEGLLRTAISLSEDVQEADVEEAPIRPWRLGFQLCMLTEKVPGVWKRVHLLPAPSWQPADLEGCNPAQALCQ